MCELKANKPINMKESLPEPAVAAPAPKVNKALETIKARVKHDFGYHAPKIAKVGELHGQIRTKCEELAQFLLTTVPTGREQANAITKLEEVMMWANAGLARNQNYIVEAEQAKQAAEVVPTTTFGGDSNTN